MTWKWLGGCKPKSPEIRFNEYAMPVPEAGCWLWTGAIASNGYGRFKVDGKPVVASRFAWSMANGEIPTGMLVCHKCDTPSCVNPNHLFIGSHQDNMDDRERKGRISLGAKHAASFSTRATGEHNGNSKITAQQASEIRADGRPQRAIAATHGVTQALVSLIKQNKIWRNV
jgi:hypothetical protein